MNSITLVGESAKMIFEEVSYMKNECEFSYIFNKTKHERIVEDFSKNILQEGIDIIMCKILLSNLDFKMEDVTDDCRIDLSINGLNNKIEFKYSL